LLRFLRLQLLLHLLRPDTLIQVTSVSFPPVEQLPQTVRNCSSNAFTYFNFACYAWLCNAR